MIQYSEFDITQNSTYVFTWLNINLRNSLSVIIAHHACTCTYSKLVNYTQYSLSFSYLLLKRLQCCWSSVMPRLRLMSCLLVLSAWRISGESSGPHHEPTDYCDLLGQDDINGLKHGFLAGNNVHIAILSYLTSVVVTRMTKPITVNYIYSEGASIATFLLSLSFTYIYNIYVCSICYDVL